MEGVGDKEKRYIGASKGKKKDKGEDRYDQYIHSIFSGAALTK